jgi:hypothetical protein
MQVARQATALVAALVQLVEKQSAATPESVPLKRLAKQPHNKQNI